MNHSSDKPARRLPEWFWGLLLAVGTVLAYQPVWHAGFIWDDDAHLTANPCIVGPLGFKDIWTSSAAVYYPLVLTSFWIQHAIWGLNPLPYHLVDVAFHAACGLLLWRVLRRLNIPGAWLGAALWTLHPVQVESAAWITELKNTQSCFFYLLAIFFFLKWREAANPPFEIRRSKFAGWLYALTLLCATLAILSKSSTVMLPVVFGLCWWWMDGRWRWRNSFRLVPFFLISAAAGGWTIWEQQFHAGALGSAWVQGWPERLLVSSRDVWFYLGKLLWPHPLIFIYPRWTVDASRPAAWLPAMAIVAVFCVLWLARRRMRPFFFAFAYFLVSLFPALDFFNVYFFRYSFVGDHFQYLASMGPLALAGAGITAAFGSLRKINPFLKPAFCAALLLSLGALAWRQCRMFTDNETLWSATIERNPNAFLAYADIGVILFNRGKIDEAWADYWKSIELNPDSDEAYSDIGVILNLRGRTRDAITVYQKALRINPNNSQARYNLALSLFQEGRLDEAIVQFQKVLETGPDSAIVRCNLGNALFNAGRVDESIVQFKRALEINPSLAEARSGLTNALMQAGSR